MLNGGIIVDIMRLNMSEQTCNTDVLSDKRNGRFDEVDDDEYIPMTNEDIDAMFD